MVDCVNKASIRQKWTPGVEVALYKQDNCLIFHGIHCIAYVLYHTDTQEDFLAFADKPIETKTCDKEIVLDQIMLETNLM